MSEKPICTKCGKEVTKEDALYHHARVNPLHYHCWAQTHSWSNQSGDVSELNELRKRVEVLERELAMLRRSFIYHVGGSPDSELTENPPR